MWHLKDLMAGGDFTDSAKVKDPECEGVLTREQAQAGRNSTESAEVKDPEYEDPLTHNEAPGVLHVEIPFPLPYMNPSQPATLHAKH